MILELDRRTIQNWRRHGCRDRRKGSQRFVPHRLTEDEEQRVLTLAFSPEFAGSTPEQIVATIAARGVYIASARTFYRLLAKHKALAHRRESRKPRKPVRPVYRDVTASNQVWSWDITWLKTEVAGIFLYAYTIIDVYDRSIVGWIIETTESEEHATQLFRRTIRNTGVCPVIVHADNGNPMREMTLAVFLDALQVTRSYSRPRYSNDNAHIESWHKTLKYTVGYPSKFTSINHARVWYADFVHWYNTRHQHSGIGYVTPQKMRSGEAWQIFEARNKTLEEARKLNPTRWRQAKVRVYKPDIVKVYYRPVKDVS